MSFGPERGTPKFQEQVDRILKVLNNAKPQTEDEISGIVLMYVLDTSYARGAIAEADSKYRKQLREEQK